MPPSEPLATAPSAPDAALDAQGRIFRHHKGQIYRWLMTATDSESLYVLVVYQNVETGAIWARPMREFLEVLPDGTPRFERMEAHVR